MSQHTFYQGLDIHAAEAIDKRFYIDSLTVDELKRVFGSDGRYGFAKAFLFNKSLNKFQYLTTFVSKVDVINISNWSTIQDSSSSFVEYNIAVPYILGNCVYFINSSNVLGFYIGLTTIAAGETPESDSSKWLNISSPTIPEAILTITLNRSALLSSIASNSLVPGVTYKITGVHPTLYNDGSNSGTTIYLKALSVNTIEKIGHGEFWNPKYDKTTSGFNIWDQSNSVSVGTKKIWGGYSWTNLTGSVGMSSSVLALDTNWSKNTYTLTNYNKVLDVIEYDLSNDWISRRYEIESGNDVKCIKTNNIRTFTPIQVMQYGNGKTTSNPVGVTNILVDNGYFESINFRGSVQENIRVNVLAYQQNCIYGLGCRQFDIDYKNSSNQSNVEFKSGSIQSMITFNQSSSMSNFIISNNRIMSKLSLATSISLTNITLSSSQNISNILIDGSISTVDLSSASIIYASYLKTIYQRPDNTVKIRYYDNDDALIITDITD